MKRINEKCESCLMVAKWFEQVTYACEECSNLQDTKPIFMITDFKISPVVLSVLQLFLVNCKGKTPLSLSAVFIVA